MDLLEVMQARHSVRQYQSRPLEEEASSALRREIEACNRESGLHIQLVTSEPKAFDGFMAHYGKFRGVTNYIAMIGKPACGALPCRGRGKSAAARRFPARSAPGSG